MVSFLRVGACAMAMGVVSSMAGCAGAAQARGSDTSSVIDTDPYESFNRAVFFFNEQADIFVVRPVAEAYATFVPLEIRRLLDNFMINLGSPVAIANSVMQGDGERATRAFGRFVLNTVFGIGGVLDVAAEEGLMRVDEDFGQTLAVWGVGPGPYLMLPLLGPSSVRDTSGRVVDALLNPLTYFFPDGGEFVSPTLATAGLVSRRARNIELVEAAERSSIDLYAALRSSYGQQRKNLIYNGVLPQADDPFPPFDDDAFE